MLKVIQASYLKGTDSSLLKLYAWLSLVSQILIVVTGGVVRLTASGLGCPTWPKCTADSLVTVPEQGIHGIIEFGNRMLTFVLLLIAALTLLTVLRSAQRSSQRLLTPAVQLVVGIFAQAIIGGITVWTGLNPWLVAIHYLVSAFMIVWAVQLVWRVLNLPASVIPNRVYAITPAVTVTGFVAVAFGVIVTGAGPNSGDIKSVRNGFDLEVWQHYHSYPAYLMLLLTLVTLVWQRSSKLNVAEPAVRITLLLLLVSLVQAAVGIAQSRLGLPAGLVGVHVALSAVLVALLTFNYLANRAK